MKIKGLLPKLSLGLSDKGLEDLLLLVQSIPLPKSDPVPVANVSDLELEVSFYFDVLTDVINRLCLRQV